MIINRKLYGAVMHLWSGHEFRTIYQKGRRNTKMLTATQENLCEPSCPLWFSFCIRQMKNAQLRRLRVQKLCFSCYRPKYLAFLSAYSFHFSGRSSSAKMADTGHTGTHAPQSMHSTGSMNSMSVPSNCGSSFLGWIQSTGHASTQAASLVPMQGSAITYAIEVKVSVSQ